MKTLSKMTKFEAIVLLVLGLIMGTVFTFGVQYWNAPITQDKAQRVTATFSSAIERSGRGYVKEIIVRFEDHKQLYIDGSCVDDALCYEISKITSGTVLKMMMHPNSNVILDMEIGKTKILNFHDSVQQLSSEGLGFMVLGVFCYSMAFMGAGHFILQKKR